MGQFRGPLTDVRYLQAAAEHVADLKSQSLDALGLVPGATVLDVGCGPGADVQALAAAKAYRVVGVDICLPMLGAARTGAATRAAFICANATSLPFSDGAFDAVRSERMLQHLPDPASAVTEMVRVTRPGGRLVLIDTDWASLTIEGTGAPATGQLLKDILLQHVAASPTAGRDLPAYAARNGIQTLKVSHTAFSTGDARFARLITHLDTAENTALATGLLDEPGLARWRASLASASRRGTLRCSLTLVMLLAVRRGGPVYRCPELSGTRPAPTPAG
jgi:SAM-dependent methyltransferase